MRLWGSVEAVVLIVVYCNYKCKQANLCNFLYLMLGNWAYPFSLWAYWTCLFCLLVVKEEIRNFPPPLFFSDYDCKIHSPGLRRALSLSRRFSDDCHG